MMIQTTDRVFPNVLKKSAYFQMAPVIGASRMFVFVKDVAVDIRISFIVGRSLLLFYSFMTHNLKHEFIGRIFRETPSQSHCEIMFAALCCQGPEELSMCRACCGPSALHPEERPCGTKIIRSFDQLYIPDL